jgi:hypothetical protein
MLGGCAGRLRLDILVRDHCETDTNSLHPFLSLTGRSALPPFQVDSTVHPRFDP